MNIPLIKHIGVSNHYISVDISLTVSDIKKKKKIVKKVS